MKPLLGIYSVLAARPRGKRLSECPGTRAVGSGAEFVVEKRQSGKGIDIA